MAASDHLNPNQILPEHRMRILNAIGHAMEELRGPKMYPNREISPENFSVHRYDPEKEKVTLRSKLASGSKSGMFHQYDLSVEEAEDAWVSTSSWRER